MFDDEGYARWRDQASRTDREYMNRYMVEYIHFQGYVEQLSNKIGIAASLVVGFVVGIFVWGIFVCGFDIDW